MRPCNQCRQPVENDITICDECRQWNEVHPEDDLSGLKPPLETPLESESKPIADHSYAILMGTFSLVITALFALIGLEVDGLEGFMIGGSIGFFIGLALFSIMIKT